MRDKRRRKISLLFGVMVLLGAIVVSGSVAQSTPVRTEVGILRLHLDNDGKYFRFDRPTPGVVQSINGSCPVTPFLSTDPKWVELTGGTTSFTLNRVGLSNNGLGVKYLNCGRVDAPNWALRVKLGTDIDGPGIGIDRAELDLQGWGNATVVADLYNNGVGVGSVTQAISGSGARKILVIDRTGTGKLFDEIRIHPKNLLQSVALRGGGAGSPAAAPGTLRATLGTTDTLFRVVSETDLTVTKTPVTAQITAGGNIPAAFKITVTNNGSDALSNVGISDALPPELIWLESANECSIDQSQLLTCSIPTLAKAVPYSVTVSAQAPTQAGVVTNLDATVTANGAVYHSGPAEVTVVSGAPLLTFDLPNGAQPTPTKLGDCINSPDCATGGVKVYAADLFQNPVNGSIIMSIGTDPTHDPDDPQSGFASLDGTSNCPAQPGEVCRTTSNGVATFPDLTIDRTSSGYQLLATLGSATDLSDEFAITNTDDSCGDPDNPCQAEFSPGHTVSAPPGTTLIIETNQLFCDDFEGDGIAGTVTIIHDPDFPMGTITPVQFTDSITLPLEGPFPFCKSPTPGAEDPEITGHLAPLCNTIEDGLDKQLPVSLDGQACVTQSVELIGGNQAILHSTLYVNEFDPPKGKH